VALLGDVTEIPRGLPSPVLPDFGAIPQLLLPALSLTIVGLAVASGVSQSYPEPDGSPPMPLVISWDRGRPTLKHRQKGFASVRVNPTCSVCWQGFSRTTTSGTVSS
jgi:hypothetical protein